MTKFIRLVLNATYITAALVSQAFAQAPAGGPGTNMIAQPLFAANLGVYYLPINYGNGTYGLRLTGALPGSPAAQLRLGAGDIIFALDGQRFTSANDVANHVDQTIVEFVDARTNTLRRGSIHLPSAGGPPQRFPRQVPTPGAPMMALQGNQGNGSNVGQQAGQFNSGLGLAQGVPRPQLARGLGIYYVPIRFGDGTFGLRLTAAAIPGSPASQLNLDSGDMVFALDGQRFRTANDVANHHDQTTVEFVHAGTNTLQRGFVNLGSNANPSQSIPGNGAGAPAAAQADNQIGVQGGPPAGNADNQIALAGGVGTGSRFGGSGLSAGGPQPAFAKNLGIYYVPANFGNGTFGLRLTAAALPGSPASQIPLDAGDMVFALDGQRFTSPGDVANHFDQTTVDFVDSATNTQQRRVVNLPSQNP